jgi:hypothetical protein
MLRSLYAFDQLIDISRVTQTPRIDDSGTKKTHTGKKFATVTQTDDNVLSIDAGKTYLLI